MRCVIPYIRYEYVRSSYLIISFASQPSVHIDGRCGPRGPISPSLLECNAAQKAPPARRPPTPQSRGRAPACFLVALVTAETSRLGSNDGRVMPQWLERVVLPIRRDIFGEMLGLAGGISPCRCALGRFAGPGTATGESVGPPKISGRRSSVCHRGKNWALQVTIDFLNF
jgi:hypothetical protein